MDAFYKRLCEAQNELKCQKSQYNSFGKYSYRSCEDILEAAKPVCRRHDLLLLVSDDVVQIGGRYYVKATASLHDLESDQHVESVAFAREPETKKGMDDSQVTGTASSYARKYALNGLFCIDDNKDPDTNEYAKSNLNAPATPEPPVNDRVTKMVAAFGSLQVTKSELQQFVGKPVEKFTGEDIDKLTGIFKAIKAGANKSEYFGGSDLKV